MHEAQEQERGRGAVIAGFVVVVLLVILDQWSKAAVFDWIRPGLDTLVTDSCGHRRQIILGEWLSLMISCNPGAAFGRFGEYPEALVCLRILAVGFLAVLLWRADVRQRTVLVAMVLVLSGAVGNVIDNLWTGCVAIGSESGRPYGVRDFINVWFKPLFGWDKHFPSFNVADSCISVGAVLWVAVGFLHPHPEPAADEEETSGPEDRTS